MLDVASFAAFTFLTGNIRTCIEAELVHIDKPVRFAIGGRRSVLDRHFRHEAFRILPVG